jgi:hypothetical protein
MRGGYMTDEGAICEWQGEREREREGEIKLAASERIIEASESKFAAIRGLPQPYKRVKVGGGDTLIIKKVRSLGSVEANLEEGRGGGEGKEEG